MDYSLSGRYRLENATIVDTRTGMLLEKQSILINNSKIASIIPMDEVKPDSKVDTIDIKGKYVVPGYLDMHIHVMENADISGYLKLLTANGVTGFRQMAGSAALLKKRKNNKLGIAPYDPELLCMPGELITLVNVRNTKQAIEIAQKQQAEGADFLKIAFLTTDLYKSVQEEANRLGILVAGHVPVQMDLSEASKAGMYSIEHMGNSFADQCSSSTDKKRLFALAPDAPKAMLKIPPMLSGMTVKLLNSTIVNPQANCNAATFERLKRIMETYSRNLAVESADVFVKNGTWHVPTLIRRKTSQLSYLKEFRDNPELRYVPAKELQSWVKITDRYESILTPERKQLLEKNYKRQMEILKIYDEQGVKLLAGSDAIGGGWMIAGFSLHHEFDELEKAGLSPLKVLQMTTLNGAEFLGKTDTMGTVEAGKNADLVILDQDPTKSVQNLHTINSVIRAGYLYNSSDIKEMKRTEI